MRVRNGNAVSISAVCSPSIYVVACDTIYRDFAGLSSTHVIQASVRLGIISMEEAAGANARKLTAGRWQELLAGTDLVPIDVHTPLWLWSRGKFKEEI